MIETEILRDNKKIRDRKRCSSEQIIEHFPHAKSIARIFVYWRDWNRCCVVWFLWMSNVLHTASASDGFRTARTNIISMCVVSFRARYYASTQAQLTLTRYNIAMWIQRIRAKYISSYVRSRMLVWMIVCIVWNTQHEMSTYAVVVFILFSLQLTWEEQQQQQRPNCEESSTTERK